MGVSLVATGVARISVGLASRYVANDIKNKVVERVTLVQ
jgi:hypothetical protein